MVQHQLWEAFLASKIGVLGGTFNPIHKGHVLLAQDASERLDLDYTLMVPCAVPWHKSSEGLAPAEHRLAMTELALADDPRLRLSTVDIDRGGPSYSVDTIADLSKQLGDVDLHFLIGGDSLLELHTWKRVYDLLNACKVISMPRLGSEVSDPSQIQLDAPWPERLVERQLAGPIIDIASSDIRERVRAGKSIHDLVPDAVEAYILEHSLYV